MYAMDHEIDSLLGKVIPKITPTQAERREEQALCKEVMGELRRAVPQFIEISLAGSVAKDTNVRGDRDLDIFMLFPLSHSLKDLEVMGLEWAKKAISPHKWHIGYAEHPYLRATFKGSKVDIVPSFRISHISEKASSVDRSPLHTKYVNARLSGGQRDQVRLLKKFLKNMGVYGAELKTEGFSGYLCELLIIYYGSFKQLLKSAEQWRGQVVIDIDKHYGEHELAGKFSTPLVVIDPVDRGRNVSAVVSLTSLSRFIYASRDFLEKPSEGHFFSEGKPLTKSRARALIRSRGTQFLCLLFKAPKVVPDILWPQLKRAERNIAKHLELEGFGVFAHSHWTDESSLCALLFEFDVYSLPEVRKITGPPVSKSSDCREFLRRHKRAWIEGDRILSLERRRYRDAESMLRAAMKKPVSYGIPENISKAISRAKVLKGEAVAARQTTELLGIHLDKRLP